MVKYTCSDSGITFETKDIQQRYEQLLEFVIKISKADEPSRRVSMQIVHEARDLLKEME